MLGRASTLAAVATLALPALAHGALTGTPEVVEESLDVPWELVAVPDGRYLVTERAGRVRVIASNGDLCTMSAFTDPTADITVRKFLGLALHPDWDRNGFVYLYETYTEGGVNRSRILRLVDNGSTLTLESEIFDGIGSDLSHDGGRIAFGPDGKLYVTTGDIHNPALPRDPTKLNGKILRMEPDGQPVASNPFFSQGGDARYVYSMGHRHPQGLAWDAAGRLWETEHGPSGEAHAPAGATNGRDELNLIVAGGDYGWPTVAGDQTLPGTIPPKVHSGPAPAWAPGDLAFARDGALYAPMLNGQHLRRFVLAGENVASHDVVYNTYGRLRVGVAAGDTFWFTQDGSTADLMRVGIDGPLPAFGSAGCGALGTGPDRTPDTNPNTGTTGTGTQDTRTDTGTVATGAQLGGLPVTATVPPVLTAPVPRAVVDVVRPLDRLLARARTALRRPGALDRLRRTGRLTLGMGGVSPGRIVLRLRAQGVTVAQGGASPRSRSAFTLRLRLTERGRSAVLRRLVLETAYQPAGGARVVRARAVR